MPISKLTLEIEIPHAQSLKDRRQVVRSMKDKLRHSFNLSIAELDDGIVWNRATLGIVAISNSTSYLTGQMQQIDDAAHRIAATLSADIIDSYAEILSE
jgi:uncharacterized protein YlxP (DUF503 family)